MKYDTPDKKQDSYTAILRFMTKGDITLNAQDDIILSRWILCDVLLRTKKHDEDFIINEIIDKYSVSKHTARNDIYNAQRLFGKTRQIQKSYLIQQHLERIDKDIEAVRARIFTKYKHEETGVEYDSPIDAKELAALAKLQEVYTYTLNSVPHETDKAPLPPPIFQFILPPGTMIEKPMDKDQALSVADELLNLKDGIYQPDDEK